MNDVFAEGAHSIRCLKTAELPAGNSPLANEFFACRNRILKRLGSLQIGDITSSYYRVV